MLTPFNPIFIKLLVKLGFTGVYIMFLISLKNIDCGYSLEPPCWGGSNVYPQSMFWAEYENYKNFSLIVLFFGGKMFSIRIGTFSLCLYKW